MMSQQRRGKDGGGYHFVMAVTEGRSLPSPLSPASSEGVILLILLRRQLSDSTPTNRFASFPHRLRQDYKLKRGEDSSCTRATYAGANAVCGGGAVGSANRRPHNLSWKENGVCEQRG